MAVAWANNVMIYGDNNNRMAQVNIVYLASGLNQPSTIFVDISGVGSVAQLSTALTTAVRADATEKGISVPANQVWLPGYQAT